MDSSALFSAVLSKTGAARELFSHAINGEIQLVISEDVIIETRKNIISTAPDLEALVERLFLELIFEIVPSPPKEAVWAAEKYVVQKDAFIVAAAILAKVDYLATFDRKHLINPPEVSKNSGLNIETPGGILNQIRDR
jgi:predicted nucleic acid-binding protein